MTLIAINDLVTNYGEVEVLRGVSLHVDEGEMVGIVGPNGAGKTTLLKSISKLIEPQSGTIIFEGIDVTKNPSHVIAKKGIIQVPEGRRLFPQMSVLENLLLGAYTIPKEKREGLLESVFSIFPRLMERSTQRAGTLSGGEQQMAAIGRALMSSPRLLMLDEPSLGLAPQLVEETFNAVKRINESGTTILLVEQNVYECLKFTSRAYVLENGHIELQGDCSELLKTDHIQRIYLGI